MSLPSLSQILNFVGVQSPKESAGLLPARISKRAERWINRNTSVSVVSIEIDGTAHHLAVVSSDHGVSMQPLISALGAKDEVVVR